MSAQMLDYARNELRRQYLAHEISADAYAALAEDIKLAERRTS